MLGRSSFLAAALGVAIASAGFGGMHHAVPTPQANVSSKRKKGLFGGMLYTQPHVWSYCRHGMTMAQQKRTASKKRNQVRHKAACRRRA